MSNENTNTPDPQNGGQDDVTRILEKLSTELAAAREKQATTEPQPDASELLEQGEYDKAVDRLKQDLSREALRNVTPLATSVIDTARRLARQEIGPEVFDKYLPEAREKLKADGIDVDQLATVDDYKKVIAFARSLHIDEEIEQARKAAREEALKEFAKGNADYMPPVGPGSTGGEEPDEKTRELLNELDREEMMVARDLGLDPVAYARSKKLADSSLRADGSVMELTVLDEDLEFNERGRSKTVEPGKF